MDPDTFRSDIGIEGTDVYWRRRMAVLTGVLVVVAVVAWACTSASGRQTDTGAAKGATPGPDALVVSLPSPLASPSASGSGDSASPAASPSTAKEAKDGKDAKDGKNGGDAKAAKDAKDAKEAKAAAPRRPGDACDPKDLVLSLRGGQQTYAGSAEPTFLMTIVSTGRVDCTVDVGPRMLETRIVSGNDRVWSTADCVSGEGTDIQMLKRGVPYVRTIRWDRHRSGADCAVKRAAALPGTYVAWTHADGLQSSKTVFYLR
ncbi:hypothetical protein [Microtetraspora sp. NBRC 16547]|uniref:hypothetical protein n=1 Tax=Microtetraspora sp. NBRC 16547 TaxID=3030993 RepID=UPI0024A211D9|nr:hypothetical protein [Microtetraspora sp. NBRC 16547]GLX00643.1 hypothetical protein Misp02_47290 [Microtetraspora sp. NBRC 16547]